MATLHRKSEGKSQGLGGENNRAWSLLTAIGENGEVVWTSGPMKKRLWEDVRPNTHAETTIEVICSHLK